MPASKNTAHDRGRHCEQIVIENLLAKGYGLVQERARLGGVEVDLLFSKRAGDRLIVEVKSLSQVDWMPWRLGHRQRQRLRRAAQILIERGYAVEIWLAFVGPEPHSVQFLPEF